MPTRCPPVAALVAVAAVLAALAGPAVAAGSDPLRERQWHLEAVSAPSAWSVSRGEAVTVAVVDTGVDADHPDLAGQVLEGYDATDPGATPDDGNGHGTLVAGVIAAVVGNAEGGSGVAPEASIMPVRVLDDDGRGRPSDVAEGIRWATDAGADVINLSLVEGSGPADGLLDGVGLVDREVEDAIRDAHAAGAVVVGAAGNDGDDEVPYSSDLPLAVVGASDRDGRRWHRSNADGDTLFAPGVDIVSTWSEGRYAQASGTSFAAPIVAGGAALLLDAGHPPRAVVTRLRGTAQPTSASGGVEVVDFAAAVDADDGQGAAPPPDPDGEADRTQQAASDDAPEPAEGDGRDDAGAGGGSDDEAAGGSGEAEDEAPSEVTTIDPSGERPTPGDEEQRRASEAEDIAAGDQLTVGESGGPPPGPVVIAWTLLGGVLAGHAVFARRLFD